MTIRSCLVDEKLCEGINQDGASDNLEMISCEVCSEDGCNGGKTDLQPSTTSNSSTTEEAFQV